MKRFPAAKDILYFQRSILKWFRKHKRQYPWRDEKDPFKLLIAEMMLQRTKADQVLPVYKEFFLSYNTPFDVARADLTKLNQILYSLGLRWRINKIKEVSEFVTKEFGGNIPEARNDILKLPGVGQYVAGIVLSTAFNKPEWIVDSNVVRVFKRYFGLVTSKEGRRDKHIIDLAKGYVACGKPRETNLALLDFAALVCTPRKARHDNCPVSLTCHHFRKECSSSR